MVKNLPATIEVTRLPSLKGTVLPERPFALHEALICSCGTKGGVICGTENGHTVAIFYCLNCGLFMKAVDPKKGTEAGTASLRLDRHQAHFLVLDMRAELTRHENSETKLPEICDD